MLKYRMGHRYSAILDCWEIQYKKFFVWWVHSRYDEKNDCVKVYNKLIGK